MGKIRCCVECKNRYEACHDTCIKYVAEKLVQDGIKAEIEDKRIEQRYLFEKSNRIREKTRQKRCRGSMQHREF